MLTALEGPLQAALDSILSSSDAMPALISDLSVLQLFVLVSAWRVSQRASGHLNFQVRLLWVLMATCSKKVYSSADASDGTNFSFIVDIFKSDMENVHLLES
jgi:hypothetical protein